MWQEIIVSIIVFVAAVYLGWRFWGPKKAKSGMDGDGCGNCK